MTCSHLAVYPLKCTIMQIQFERHPVQRYVFRISETSIFLQITCGGPRNGRTRMETLGGMIFIQARQHRPVYPVTTQQRPCICPFRTLEAAHALLPPSALQTQEVAAVPISYTLHCHSSFMNGHLKWTGVLRSKYDTIWPFVAWELWTHKICFAS